MDFDFAYPIVRDVVQIILYTVFFRLNLCAFFMNAMRPAYVPFDFPYCCNVLRVHKKTIVTWWALSALTLSRLFNLNKYKRKRILFVTKLNIKNMHNSINIIIITSLATIAKAVCPKLTQETIKTICLKYGEAIIYNNVVPMKSIYIPMLSHN